MSLVNGGDRVDNSELQSRVPVNTLMHGSLRYALRTLYEEIAEFRFAYPLMTVPEAGPKESLHYYWFKYRKRPPNRSVMRLDSNGIAMVWGRTTGIVYRPAFIAMWGLGNLGHYLRNGNQEHLDIFLNQVNWLEQHAVIREDGAAVWPHNFDLQEATILLKAPWVSCNVQGLVISALVRGWRITRRPRLLELLNGSARVFELDCASGGVRIEAEGHVVYAEVAGLPAPGIMDGFMTSLLGLYDLYVETGDGKVYKLFMQGVEGLKHFLPRWDYRRKWSFYANRSYLCHPMYHCLNRTLLTSLADLTGDQCFAEYAEAWDPKRLSLFGRAEIYVAFVLTKNCRRLKRRTWLQKTVTSN
jgi:hypothetical protein